MGLRFLTSFLGAYHALPCFYHDVVLYILWAKRPLTLTLFRKGMFTFPGKSILLLFIFRVVPSHLIFIVSHRECLSNCMFWGLGCPFSVNMCNMPFNSLSLRGT